MKLSIYLVGLLFSISTIVFSQDSFRYEVELSPVTIANFPGLHSYAFAQHDGKWLILGGRKDGLHARQPFNTFPALNSNTDIYVVDIETKAFWSASINNLPTGLKEQLQSTNMNFFQDADTLYIIGGYGFSVTANDHITYSNLTTISVSSLMDSIVNGNAIDGNFKQITDAKFAVTGGQLGKIKNTFYLVGGQKFDGRYNPMGHNTYTQAYTNEIRKFEVNNTGNQLSFSNYTAINDPVNLRRRDYNLLPQIFPNGKEGYTISSGVFQQNVDLPFLYPVDIDESGHVAIPSFNQYLSNYHSAKACLFDSSANEMHTLFFGGMSQYYYENGQLVQDNSVPFVKTISRLTRESDGSLHEYQSSTEMPGLKGASSEFIPNLNLPNYNSEILKLNEMDRDTMLIGYVVGGIQSPSLNPFTVNQTNTTSADNTIYAVTLKWNPIAGVDEIDGSNPYDIEVYPNPVSDHVTIKYELNKSGSIYYFISNMNGQMILDGKIQDQTAGMNEFSIDLPIEIEAQNLILTLVFENKYYVSKRIIVE